MQRDLVRGKYRHKIGDHQVEALTTYRFPFRAACCRATQGSTQLEIGWPKVQVSAGIELDHVERCASRIVQLVAPDEVVVIAAVADTTVAVGKQYASDIGGDRRVGVELPFDQRVENCPIPASEVKARKNN